MSLRRIARVLKIDRRTVERKVKFLAKEALQDQERLLDEWLRKPGGKLTHIQFDEMETFEHTKCKPLSIALAVDGDSRKILSIEVSQMPAKGLLAKTALRKYGYREDHRAFGLERMFCKLPGLVDPQATLRSDRCPRYPSFVRQHFPEAKHSTTLGGRGCIVGQTELKRKRFDPIFSLNHTAASIRDNLRCMARRTWATTKKIEGLIARLTIYVSYHNRVLTPEH